MQVFELDANSKGQNASFHRHEQGEKSVQSSNGTTALTLRNNVRLRSLARGKAIKGSATRRSVISGLHDPCCEDLRRALRPTTTLKTYRVVDLLG